MEWIIFVDLGLVVAVVAIAAILAAIGVAGVVVWLYNLFITSYLKWSIVSASPSASARLRNNFKNK